MSSGSDRLLGRNYKIDRIMSDMTDTFAIWLNAEIKKRGWSQSELARQAHVSRTAISDVIAEKHSAGFELCAAIAKALHVPPEEVFRLAGVLPPRPEEDPLTQEAEYLLSGLSKELREQAVTYIRFLYQQEVGNGKASTAAGVGKAQPKTP